MLNLKRLVEQNPQWNAISIFHVGQVLKNKPVIQSVIHSVVACGDDLHAQRELHHNLIPIHVAKNVTDYIRVNVPALTV